MAVFIFIFIYTIIELSYYCNHFIKRSWWGDENCKTDKIQNFRFAINPLVSGYTIESYYGWNKETYTFDLFNYIGLHALSVSIIAVLGIAFNQMPWSVIGWVFLGSLAVTGLTVLMFFLRSLNDLKTKIEGGEND